MEYYNLYNHDYIRVAKRQKKYPCTKVEILDRDEFILGDISRDVIAESDNVSYVYNQGVQGKLSFRVIDFNKKYFGNKIGDSLLWFGRKIKFYKGLIDEENGDIYWWSQGIFVITGVSREDGILQVEAVDKFGIFTSATGLSALDLSAKIEAGLTVGGIISGLLGRPDGNSRMTDPKPPLVDPSASEIINAQDIELSSGSHIGGALIGMANMCRCRIFYDRSGSLRVTNGSLDYLYSVAAPVWKLDKKTTAEYLSSSLNFDFTKVINQITVIGEHGKRGEVFVSTAINNDPRSPVSVDRIGFKTGKTMENMYGYNQNNVDALARFYVEMKSVIGIRVPVKTTLLPHLWINDVVALSNDDYNFDNDRLLINEIAINGSDMKISLVNFDHLPYHIELK